ncbi:MAG TPA: SDR family oxidoreductase [Steroidobacteraceae bacterium]|jgi:NAD(P)-dependent dehydrogenase (short-subunit alcohol dehydrogenase family)|nr:SDR family oxidoreductase [Steroidobacteraceae bacterium]
MARDAADSRAAPPVEQSLAGRVALVTGSGRGLGRAIAQQLAQLGAVLAIHDLSEQAPAEYGEAATLSESARSLFGPAGRGTVVTGDVTDEAAVQRIVESVHAALGPICILVNCAGGDIGARGTKPNPNGATAFQLDDARAVIDRNLIGTMLMCRAVAPAMAARQTGVIINIASVAAHYGSCIEVAYACAKAAVVHYTRCLAAEVREAGVRVNCVSPGPAKTARFLATRGHDAAMMQEGPSLRRYATAPEIADAVAFLASDRARFVSGQVLRVDGAAGLYAA